MWEKFKQRIGEMLRREMAEYLLATTNVVSPDVFDAMVINGNDDDLKQHGDGEPKVVKKSE